ncbi:MAG: UDP-glucose 4-epimerase GalE [Chitinispirillaceae bacterium]|nr:UDP-glucose 4-epimerase GalE [Chitinispirillaceae bacterium]
MAGYKKNILVVGGAGYIGSHVCKELSRSGYTPVSYDNLVYGHEWAVKWGPFAKGDIHDVKRLREVMSANAIDAVIHLAAFAYVGESVAHPAKYYRNNVAGSLSLFEAMRETQVKNIVFSSTCAVYGIPQEIPITERSPRNPVNPYGASKLMIERILEDYHRAYGFNSVSLRYFNAAGADPDAEIGEAHDPETHLIPLMLDAGMGRREELKVFGNTYPTRDGTCIRDYIHVTDLARAHVLALDLIERKQSMCVVMNLGTGQGHSIMEMIEKAKEIIGRNIPYSIAPPREGDPPVLVADPTDALAQLNWKARYADIGQIITHAWNFHKNV